MKTLNELNSPPAVTGCVKAIVVRAGAREAACAIESATTLAGIGLADDRRGRHGRAGVSTSQVTRIQHEPLPVIAALARAARVDPLELRGNFVVAGINLLARRNRRLRVGAALFEIFRPCHPCSRMAEAIGPGGCAAMRGHGGVCARDRGRSVAVGDPVRAEDVSASAPTG